jgi:hypothetical protein
LSRVVIHKHPRDFSVSWPQRQQDDVNVYSEVERHQVRGGVVAFDVSGSPPTLCSRSPKQGDNASSDNSLHESAERRPGTIEVAKRGPDCEEEFLRHIFLVDRHVTQTDRGTARLNGRGTPHKGKGLAEQGRRSLRRVTS